LEKVRAETSVRSRLQNGEALQVVFADTGIL